MSKIVVGFIGAGGIARAHAFALQSLKYYYENVPDIILGSVTSERKESREKFSKKYGFQVAQEISEFVKNKSLDTIFILGPNKVHFEHLILVAQMPNVKRIYIEKPVCSTMAEEEGMYKLLREKNSDLSIQVGFQFVQYSAVRECLAFYKSGIIGRPIHFDLKYYHGDYLQSDYRAKRKTRLTAAPDGGAMADLGSHGISLLMAFFGERLQIVNAMQSGQFEDVPNNSDLFSTLSLFDPDTKAVGNLSASRVSSGTGDWVNLEIFAEKGAIKYSSYNPDYFEYYLESENCWVKKMVGSHYKPLTSFPSGHVSPGWLRAMIHAHHIFITGVSDGSFIPDLAHGLAVQRIVRENADRLGEYRKKCL